MKNIKYYIFGFLFLANLCVSAQDIADQELAQKAISYTAKLALQNPEKEKIVSTLILNHLSAVRNWHNEHPASTVPEGINPLNGQKLTELDRSIIADSAMPASVHQNLIDGLKRQLTEEQIDLILDQYTIGKVAFTMSAYHAIVPDLSQEEEAKILNFLKQARLQAIVFKNMKQISAIFEIYKTKAEQYLNSNGRNWRALYSAYTKKVKDEKEKAKKL